MLMPKEVKKTVHILDKTHQNELFLNYVLKYYKISDIIGTLLNVAKAFAVPLKQKKEFSS